MMCPETLTETQNLPKVNLDVYFDSKMLGESYDRLGLLPDLDLTFS